jgi:hypothetical protein
MEPELELELALGSHHESLRNQLHEESAVAMVMAIVRVDQDHQLH